MSSVKKEAIKIVNNLPEDATWEDLIYQIYVKEKVEKSIKEVDEGNVLSHDQAKKRLMET